jgi:hypothetical protein
MNFVFFQGRRKISVTLETITQKAPHRCVMKELTSASVTESLLTRPMAHPEPTFQPSRKSSHA